MLIYKSYDDITKYCDIINIILDNVPYSNHLYPLLNQKIEVFNGIYLEENSKYYYFTTSDGTDKIIKSINNNGDNIISFIIPIEFVTNREEKLKRILDIC